MGSPAVSVIVPCHNDSKFLADSLGSVVSQSFTDFEVIVVENGSTDNTCEVAKEISFKDSRIRVICFNEGLGAARARNLGIEEARGRFIAFLDGDDLWDPTKLEKQIEFMNKFGLPLTYTWYRKIEMNGQKRGLVKAPATLTYNHFRKTNFMGCSTVVMDSSQLGKRFFPEVKREDWILWLAITREGYTAHAVPECLALYRVPDFKKGIRKRFKLIKDQWIFYRHYACEGPFSSIFLFGWHVFYGSLRFIK
ncbi:glycosyltransferase family 2 protein [Thiohalorhabdus denitrificans]|uniref:Teichuronic acid biosynthesis glycosyltransferase TuaG n=1 Tax=Thiohalorhabdus denitrificans TaxID=381306 RepID=A0A1G5ANA9_9GAMM|nr:glycosyltransferase family 2 protein [Thiohalorhabdus denitrificans]SCX79379.1 teichuronic acid biosynthesis glycosyltransferase TuaG [Thiohalorhabdus denitrificans]